MSGNRFNPNKRYVAVYNRGTRTLHRPGCPSLGTKTNNPHLSPYEFISNWSSPEGREVRKGATHCKRCKPDVPKLVEGGLGYKGIGSW